MASANEAQEADSNTEPILDGYDSMMLQLYLETLAGQDQELQVLDMGPVCKENILYFSQRVKRFYVCDMFIRMDRNRRESKLISAIWNNLDYPAQSFQGIHVWDIIEHMEDRMKRENFRFNIEPLGGKMAKESRIEKLQPVFEFNRMWLPWHRLQTAS